jgi:vitamin B12 transporter
MTALATLFAAAAAQTLAAPAAAQALTTQPIVLEDIVVVPDRAPIAAERTGTTVSTITEAEIAGRAQPFALDYLTDLPGLAVTQSGPPGTLTGFTLRGVPQQYVRLRIDGIEVSDPTGTQVAPALGGLLAGDIGRIEVLKGSQSALYGGQAVGGVIDVTSLRPERDGVEQRVAIEAGRYASLRSSYGIAARTDRTDAALTLQGFRTNGFSAAEEAAGNTEADGYSTWRLSGSGSHFVGEDLRLFASGFVQREDGDYDGFPPPDFALADTDDTFEIRSWGARVGADFALGPVASTVAAARFDIDRRFFEAGAELRRFEGSRDTLEYLGRIEAGPDLAFQVGADWNRERARFGAAGADRERSTIAGAFGQATWSPVDAVTVGLALRHDEHSEFGGYTTGRLNAAWLLPTDTVLRASVGTGFRPPSLNELFGPFGPNPDLDPETSLSWDAGIEQRLDGGRGRVSATVFRIEVDDLIQFVDGGYNQVDGTAVSRGVELAGAWAATERLTLTAAYTYTEAELADGSRRARVPRHDAVIGVEARPVERLTLGANLRRVADVVDPTFAPGPELFGNFTRVDARAAYAVTDTAEVYLRAENLFDEQYQTARGYGTADRSFFFGVAARF